MEKLNLNPEAPEPGRVDHHLHALDYVRNELGNDEKKFESIIRDVQNLQVAIPSWALGTGGTRFGRFPGGGEPRNLEEKIEDIALLSELSRATQSISLHIPWDIPKDTTAIRQKLGHYGLFIDSVNSNTFQDQEGQLHSYKFGSLCHLDNNVRKQAIAHNLEVIEYGKALGTSSLTIWLSDGSNFPGQHHFRKVYEKTLDSLKAIYQALPEDGSLLLEYKPYEPNFYSMVIPDWGTSYTLCQACGKKANVLVDLGHHLPNTNTEQIVARLLHLGRLGGFHFNGSQYGDDDLTTGVVKPFQLFLIFLELVFGKAEGLDNPKVAYMIDASHNTKDPLEDLMDSLEIIRTAYAKAILVDREKLVQVQEKNDVVEAEKILRNAFLTDVRPLVTEARIRAGGFWDPLGAFRRQDIRKKLISIRGNKSLATGL